MVKMRRDEKANTLVKLYERGFPVGFTASNEVRVSNEVRCARSVLRLSACSAPE